MARKTLPQEIGRRLRERATAGWASPQWVLAAILLAGLPPRLYRLDLPLAEFYAARQVMTAEMTRNLWASGFTNLHPHVYWNGPEPAYWAQEFPLYNVLVAGLYLLGGGAHDYLGRLVSLAFSVGATWLLYLLAKEYFGPKTALWAAAFFTFSPLGIMLSRTFQPDTAMMFFGLTGVYYFHRFLQAGQGRFFFLAAASLMIAALVKLPMLHVGLPLLWLAGLKYGRRTLLQPHLWLLAILVLLPLALWLALIAQIGSSLPPEFSRAYSLAHYFRAETLVDPRFYLSLLQIETDWVLTPLGVGVLALGLVLRVQEPRQWLFHVWLLAVVLYLLAFTERSASHFYYHLPMLAPAAVLVGRALEFLSAPGLLGRTFLNRRLAQGALVILVGLLVVRPLVAHYRLPPPFEPHWDILVRAAQVVRTTTPKQALIVPLTSPGYDAHLLYYGERKGWVFTVTHRKRLLQSNPAAELDPVRALEVLRAQGAQYLVVSSPTEFQADPNFARYVQTNFRLVAGEGGYFIYDLRERPG